MSETIVNKVANSGLITLDLEAMMPSGDRILIDLADQLWQGMVVKEDDFREFVKTTDWSVYKDKYVAITCSADAIVPSWAYMLVSSKLVGVAKDIIQGEMSDLNSHLISQAIDTIDPATYQDARIMIKGCGEGMVNHSHYMQLLKKLQSVTLSIMYGEPCGAVPVYKRPRIK